MLGTNLIETERDCIAKYLAFSHHFYFLRNNLSQFRCIRVPGVQENVGHHYILGFFLVVLQDPPARSHEEIIGWHAPSHRYHTIIHTYSILVLEYALQ